MSHDETDEYKFFYIIALASFLYPLQGFLNFFVYVRPQIMEYLRKGPLRIIKKSTTSATTCATSVPIRSTNTTESDV